ncbi:MmcQ/YjbR family DNA-binding protein [Mesorhizobium sp. ANAO-SY3R2]|uniref:MmcQ/YjbR family DNA-binding protein n=1 Tax=Mesorhizobium sp. ANAO-SY3R2 TaxID=3166644 RepID=UPI00366AFFEE
MNADDARRFALALPETIEKSHFGKADFRVRNRVYATLPESADAVVKLTPDQQELLASSEPAIFQPVNGGWGRQGWTRISLAAADEPTLRSALAMAWRNTAPATLCKAFDLSSAGRSKPV